MTPNTKHLTNEEEENTWSSTATIGRKPRRNLWKTIKLFLCRY